MTSLTTENIFNTPTHIAINGTTMYVSNRNNNTLTNDSQVIDITTTKHQVIRFVFNSCYVIKDEEFFIIIQ
jgi:hypothetical protein